MKKFPWIGFAYGCVLWVFGWMAAGMGEGTYHLLAWFGAPLAIVPPLALLAPPLWWAAMEVTLRRKMPATAVTMLATHMAVAWFDFRYGIMESGEDQWRYYERAARFYGTEMRLGVALYILGLVVATVLAARLTLWGLNDPWGKRQQ